MAIQRFNSTKESRVVAFKSMDSKVRINIYYTTGTVASCLFHPMKGKSQLFFVGINLSRILGQYLRILERTPVRVIITLRNHLDDELRWRYVATVTTGFCNEQPVSQIGAICKLWNEIRFDIKNGPNTIDVYNSFSEEEKK